jgi:hypothetical protein
MSTEELHRGKQNLPNETIRIKKCGLFSFGNSSNMYNRDYGKKKRNWRIINAKQMAD